VSAILLVGLLLNSLFGGSWSDPDRRAGHRCRRDQRRPRSPARRRLLRTQPLAATTAGTAQRSDDGCCTSER